MKFLEKNKITGGKKKMKKRILSIVLAVLMLLSVMPVTAMAADRTTVNTAQNGIEATKTAK